jgi:hypothetical protein
VTLIGPSKFRVTQRLGRFQLIVMIHWKQLKVVRKGGHASQKTMIIFVSDHHRSTVPVVLVACMDDNRTFRISIEPRISPPAEIRA